MHFMWFESESERGLGVLHLAATIGKYVPYTSRIHISSYVVASRLR